MFFGRFFISDTPMVFYSVAAVLAWVMYLDTGSRRACIAGTVCAALAFLVKIPAVLILVPIAWAAWETRRGGVAGSRLVLRLPPRWRRRRSGTGTPTRSSTAPV